MEQYQNVVQDLAGNVVPEAMVRVLLPNGGNASIFDVNGAATANPTPCDSSGFFSFMAANGKYFPQVEVGGVAYKKLGPVTLFDAAEDTTRPTLTTLAASVGATLIGVTETLSLARLYDIMAFGVHNVRDPKWGGGGADPSGGRDSTLPMQAAADYAAANGGVWYVPSGSNYLADTIKFKDFVYNSIVQVAGASITGVATTNRRGLFHVVNCVDFEIFGKTRLNIANNPNYDYGVFTEVQTGTSQATTFINYHNITVRNGKVGFGFGEHNKNFRLSEVALYGCHTVKCPGGLYAGGSQTGVSLHGCNMVSEINTAFAGAPSYSISNEGAFISVNGGECVMAEQSGLSAFLMAPGDGTGTPFGNIYGVIRLNGTQIETASQLCKIHNPRGLSAPDSRTAMFSVTGGGGYAAPAAGAQPFIRAEDAGYQGGISIRQAGFYTTELRTAPNISCAGSLAKISVDMDSFGRNFMHWFGGIVGGRVDHGMQPLVGASGINATIPAGEQKLVYANVKTNGIFQRHAADYSNGNLTIHGGLTHVNWKATAVGNVSTVGDIYIKKGVAANAPIVAFGRYDKATGQINADLYDMTEGDVYCLFIAGAAASTFDNAIYQSMTISGTTQV